MITIYAPNETDFATLGLGALAPYECVVEEQAGGMYELTMTHPMDETGKWLNIGVGCVIKAPVPVRETPLAGEDEDGEIPTEPVTVTRKIYKVRTNTGANLHLRQKPSTSSKILAKYRPGTEVAVLSQANGWGQVIVRASGASGYMSMQYLVYVRDETETIQGDTPSEDRVIYPVQSRGQLFRVISVERDAAEHEVRVTARHIFYDLLGNLVKNDYAPEGVAANTVVNQIFERALNPHEFDVHCQVTGAVTGEYTRRGIVECLLDPDDGVVAQTEARLIRDNYDIWILPDMERETGVTIRHGKNLLGATMTTDQEDVVTRIIPVGQTKDGKPLLLDGTIYVDSPRINDYPIICAQAIEYDVKVGRDGINNATQARAKLRELAQADFADNGVDKPTIGLDVDFVALGETEEYKAYADLEAVHLYDTVRVIAKNAGIDAAVRVTGYKWDALGRRYEGVTLGEIADLKPTVYSYEIPRGAIKTIKIANGAIGSAQLRDLAVQYAHINTAAVEQLSANSITALKAYITEIVAGSVTTDALYVGIAEISKAQITTANINNANIDWAQITDLQAGNIDALAAYIGALTAASVETDELYAAFAHMLTLAADNIQAGSIETDSLAAVLADIIHAEVDVGEFGLAEIQNLLANALILQQGSAGSMMIQNLVVTQANLLNATIGSLIMPGTDGKYYEIIVGTDGALSTAEVTVTEDEIVAGQTEDGRQIVATTINADSINGTTINAQQAILNTILTNALTAGKITAAEAMLASATIPTLYATSIKALGDSIDISANASITLIAGQAQQAQEDAEFAKPYISATPPEEAPEAGKLWLDEGVEPSVLRKWRGAEVTTEREYEETIESDAPPITLDNTQGQLQTVAVRAECRAKQAGSGEPSPENIRAITGRDSVEIAACGKNLYDVSDKRSFSDSVTVDADGWITVTADNSAGSGIAFMNCVTNPSIAIRPYTQYAVVCEIAQINVSGSLDFRIVSTENDVLLSQFAQTFSLAVNESTQTGTRIQVLTSRADLSDAGSMLRTYVAFTKGASGTIKFRLSVLADTSITAETFVYEPYRSTGGGTVAPTEPLWGLPGAEDTVEMSVDGDVTVTRRTAALELDGTEDWLGYGVANGYIMHVSVPAIKQISSTYTIANMVCSHYPTIAFYKLYTGSFNAIGQSSNSVNISCADSRFQSVSAWKAYLAAQASSGTPVTIVYELETPQSEALSAVLPITPAKGQVNLSTDADSLTATITGTGWETVNDTSGLAGDISSTQSGLEDLSDKLDAANDAIAQMASQIITPEGIISTVEASAGYQSIKTQVEETATGLSVTNTKVTDVDGRLETIEGSVRIQGSEITLGRSDSPYQNTINEAGFVITEDGQEILAIRGSKMESARVQISDAIIIGGVAIKTASDGHVYFLRR